ncbi:SLAP domain-containing protein [Clostridium baratii]|uniref:SLAP domain-containing protein n=1 Tax=Clostridium baratii TaxID=1561 RepID=UPI00069B9257|nr:hypothetical protein [Clostridium baratii]
MNEKKIKVLFQSTKTKVALGTLGGIILGVALSSPTKEQTEAVAKLSTLTTQVESLESKNKELQVKLDEAKPWFDMKSSEQKEIEAKEKAAKEKALKEEEQKRKEEEARKESKIGERILYKNNKGTFALTINSVKKTSDRNQFADPIDNVAEISYTVENIDMDELDFFLDHNSELYNSEGYKMSTYPLSKGSGTYDIGKGKKAKGVEYYGYNGDDYLEMHFGDNIYKWNLK